jgi:hypothetical protein
VGLYWEEGSSEGRKQLTRSLFVGLESRDTLCSGWRTSRSVTGDQRVFGNRDSSCGRLKQGDVIGVLVDENACTLSFFYNRICVGTFAIQVIISSNNKSRGSWWNPLSYLPTFSSEPYCGVSHDSDTITVLSEMVFRPCITGHQFEVELLY